MKLFTVCSDSHVQLLEKHFLPSVPPTLTPVVKMTKQRDGWNFGEPGFIETMKEKLELVLGLTKTEKEAFIYSDVDVRFNLLLDPVPTLRKIIDTEGYDMACQNDIGGICAGFMVIAPTKKNSDFLEAALQYQVNNHLAFDDQRAINDVYRLNVFPNLSKPNIKLLDASSGFGNFDHIRSRGLWNPDMAGCHWNPNNQAMERNTDIIRKQFMWHANFTIGVENKLKMLERFQNICQSNVTSDIAKPKIE